jgi:hypothetical protein
MTHQTTLLELGLVPNIWLLLIFALLVTQHFCPVLGHFDLIAVIGDRLIRIQVKATARTTIRGRRHKTKFGYCFESNSQKYALTADVLAFVAIDTRKIIYCLTNDVGRRVWIKPERFSNEFCELSRVRVFGT